jgi:hypothetical protein
MTRLAVLALSTLVLAAPAAAQEKLFRNVDAQPGKQLRLAVAANVGQDCKPGKPVEIKVLTPPKNGSLAVRSGETPAGRLKRCPDLKVPVQGVFYVAKAGFSGTDEVSFEISRDGKVQTQVVRITVSEKAKPEPKDDGVNL